MSLKFVKPESAGIPYAKILLLGDRGSGKTHAALTFPDPAVIDAEGSILWFADRFQFEYVPTKSFRDVRELIQQIRANPNGRKTLVVDSLTSIYNGLVNVATEQRKRESNGAKEDLRPLEWGRIKRSFSGLMDELYHQVPLHVVCIGWIKPQYAKAGTVVDGSRVKEGDMIVLGETFDGDKKAEHAFDFIFHLESNDGKQTRARVIKSRSGKLKHGQIMENFSWSQLEALFAKVAVVPKHRGMTDTEQVARDAEMFKAVNKTPILLDLFKKVHPNEKIADWLVKYVASDLRERRSRTLVDCEFDAAFALLDAEQARKRESAPSQEKAILEEARKAIKKLIAAKQIRASYVTAEWKVVLGAGARQYPWWDATDVPMLRAFYKCLDKCKPGAINKKTVACPACAADPERPHAHDCELGREAA